MGKFLIEGGVPLSGVVQISGAKNAALPILAATLLSKKPITLHNIPILQDVYTMCSLLESLGKTVSFSDHTMVIEENQEIGYKAPYEIVHQMRASIAVMGPLVARLGKAIVSMPGGCAIGPRPIDLHIKGIKALSASCIMKHGYLEVSSPDKKLIGTTLNISGKNGSSVLATENILMAATLAQGTTIINGAAREPEVIDLAKLLNAMGAKISGAGTDSINVEGVETLHGTEHTIMPDRIEAGTFIIAAAMTDGEILVENCNPQHLEEALVVFKESGMIISTPSESSILARLGNPKAIHLTTAPYPLFPTDLQSQFLSYLSCVLGNSTITDQIYPDRFMHAAELNRMGADINILNGVAYICGVKELSNTVVMSSDLRGGAALVLASLATKGSSIVSHIHHIDRGYENLELKLQKLGANITRVP